VVELVDKLFDHVRYFYEVTGRDSFSFVQQSVALFDYRLQPPDENVVLEQILGGAHLATG